MRYGIFLEKTVNRLTPVYLRGDLNSAWLMAILTPLEELNNWFLRFTVKKRREALTTSQVMVFENFLTDVLANHLAVSTTKVTITSTLSLARPIHIESDVGYLPEEELWVFIDAADEASWLGGGGTEETGVFYTPADDNQALAYSFVVTVPPLKGNVILADFTQQLTALINKYRLAGKTFNIIFQ